jgi:hypothetical protein
MDRIRSLPFIVWTAVFASACAANATGAEPQEICDNGIDDDGDGLHDCFDEDCQDALGCVAEDCDNGFDDDGDGFIDCEDPSCASSPACMGGEICNNGVDDDGDGMVDCQDPKCASHPLCGGGTDASSRGAG